ncbi:MAG: hypothetical protein WCT01_01115 [Candidatus Shapirobacteria bacterium]
MKSDKRIPTILGLFLLLASALGAAYLSSQPTSFSTIASGDCDPDNLQVTNLTESSFDLFFATSASCQSNLILNNKTYSNLRGVTPTDKATYHYFSVSGLAPATNYSYVILSGGRKYQLNQYTVVTRNRQSSPLPASALAWGKVLTSQLTPAFAAVVFINIPGAAPISSLTNSQGFWNVPLSASFDSQGNSWFQPPPNITEDILVFYPNVDVTQITANTSRNNPLPDIILGTNSDFGQESSDISPPSEIGNLGLGKTTAAPVSSLSIDYPRLGDSVPLIPSPEFFGKSDNSPSLTLMLDSQTFTITPASGQWRWSASTPMTLGNHRLTLTSPNSSKSVDFKVVSASSFPAFTASGSATPTTVLPSPTTVPTLVPTPTTEPTTIPPTPTYRQTQPSTESGVPVTGNTTPFVLLLIVTIISWYASYRLWLKHD